MDKEEDKRIVQWLENVRDELRIIENKHRREILRFCYNNPKNISQINKHLGSSYVITLDNIKKLEKEKLVTLDRPKKEKNHPVYVTSNCLPEQVVEKIKKQFC